MKSKLLDWLIRIRTSYWFVPSVMVLIALIGSMGMVHIDTYEKQWLYSQEWWPYVNEPAAARALLSALAGSMITVASVTFSMTLLAVSHASSQVGPRLLNGFMRDRANQYTLGTFIATFLYCLMVLGNVHEGIDGQDGFPLFVPSLAIIVAILLAVVSVFVLIYFIHHVPQSISVTNIIGRVGDELIDGICCQYPKKVGQGQEVDSVRVRKNEEKWLTYFQQEAVCLKVDSSGYLRVVDGEGLMALAVEESLTVELYRRPGDFAIPGQPLLRVAPADRINDEIIERLQSVFSWGIDRTPEEDVLYPLEQLIEVLAKAMSPGVNGQYTALLCINQFERALAEKLQREVPSPYRFDKKEILRVITKPVTDEEFVFGVFYPIRQFIRADWMVTRHILSMIQRLMAMPELAHNKPLLEKAEKLIREDIESGPMLEAERLTLS